MKEGKKEKERKKKRNTFDIIVGTSYPKNDCSPK